MADNPAPEDDGYSDEEAAQRRDATIRAMIRMKPKPHTAPAGAERTRPTSPKGRVRKGNPLV